MSKHGVMPVADPTFVEAGPMVSRDQAPPGEPASYFLEAGYGERVAEDGMLTTRIIGPVQSGGALVMDVIEARRGARRASAAREHGAFLYLLDGSIDLTTGDSITSLIAGDGANLPAGGAGDWLVTSGSARLLRVSTGSPHLDGTATDRFFYSAE